MYACQPGAGSNLTTPVPAPSSAGGIVGPVQLPYLPNAGMGSAITDWLTSTTTIFGFDVSNWILVTAGGLLVWQLTGTTAKSRAKARARADYERQLADIRQRYSTAGRLKSGARKAQRLIPRVSVG